MSIETYKGYPRAFKIDSKLGKRLTQEDGGELLNMPTLSYVKAHVV